MLASKLPDCDCNSLAPSVDDSLTSKWCDWAVQLWYPLAKTLAEQQAWEFAKAHGIDLVVVNPSFVVGPMLPPMPTSTILLVLHLLRGSFLSSPHLAGLGLFPRSNLDMDRC